MINAQTILLAVAAICLIVEGMPPYPGKRVQWQWIGFAFVVLSLMVGASGGLDLP